jgi:hypothetical protein
LPARQLILGPGRAIRHRLFPDRYDGQRRANGRHPDGPQPHDSHLRHHDRLVPLFIGGLGTLIQADFEFAASGTGTIDAVGNTGGTYSLNLTGPADVGGQPMGNIPIGFTGT